MLTKVKCRGKTLTAITMHKVHDSKRKKYFLHAYLPKRLANRNFIAVDAEELEKICEGEGNEKC